MKTTFALLIASCLIATSAGAQAEDQHKSHAGKQVQLVAHYDASTRHERRQKHESRREHRQEDRQDHKHQRAYDRHDHHAAYRSHYRHGYHHQPYAQIYVRPHFGWSIHGGY